MLIIGTTSTSLPGSKRPLRDNSAKARHPPCHEESDSGSANKAELKEKEKIEKKKIKKRNKKKRNKKEKEEKGINKE